MPFLCGVLKPQTVTFLQEKPVLNGDMRRQLCIKLLTALNRPFGEWNEVFPNAACVVSLIDRLVHHSEVIAIEGESYRMKEAREQAAKRRGQKK